MSLHTLSFSHYLPHLGETILQFEQRHHYLGRVLHWGVDLLPDLTLLVLTMAGLGYLIPGLLKKLETRKRWRLALMLFFCVMGLISIGLNAFNRENQDRASKEQSSKLDAVGRTNEKILLSITDSRETQISEVARRKNIQDGLTSRYILTHNPVDPAIIAGAKLPPLQWMNEQLAAMGQTWTFSALPVEPARLVSESAKVMAELVPLVTYHSITVLPGKDGLGSFFQEYGLAFVARVTNPYPYPLRLEGLDIIGNEPMDCSLFVGMINHVGQTMNAISDECNRRKPFISVNWKTTPDREVNVPGHGDAFVTFTLLHPDGGGFSWSGQGSASQYVGYSDDGSKPSLTMTPTLALILHSESSFPQTGIPANYSSLSTRTGWHLNQALSKGDLKVSIRYSAGIIDVDPSHIAIPKMIRVELLSTDIAEELFNVPDMFAYPLK